MRTARTSFRSALVVAASVAAVLALSSCAQEDSEPAATSTSEDACADISTVKDGTITVGTSDPAFPPYVIDNKPTERQGLRVGHRLRGGEGDGLRGRPGRVDVRQLRQLFAPGEKDFDFALNQISITPKREAAVTFSDPYYEASNGVLVLKDSEFADVTTLAELQDAKIGVQIGTTALEEVETQIAPTQEVAVFDDTTAVDAGAGERADRRHRHRPADHSVPRCGRGAGDGGRPAAGRRRRRHLGPRAARRTTRWSPASTRRSTRSPSPGSCSTSPTSG